MPAPGTTTHTANTVSAAITQADLGNFPIGSYDHKIKVLAGSGAWQIEARMVGVTVGSEWVVLDTAIPVADSRTLPQETNGGWDAFRITVTNGAADNVFIHTYQTRRILF